MKILIWIAGGVAALSIIISLILYVSAVREAKNQAETQVEAQ